MRVEARGARRPRAKRGASTHKGKAGERRRAAPSTPRVGAPHPNDPTAVREYQEQYTYDLVSNITALQHTAVGAPTLSWTRTYTYQAAPSNNRLIATSGSATFGHDVHGNVTSMPHLSTITYSPFDQMTSADKGGGGIVYFTYDASGQRVRKVWEHSGLKEERLYLGGFEIYRRWSGTTKELERETLHVMDGARRIAMVETKTVDTSAPPFTPTPRYRYQLTNHLDTAHLEVDETGLVISYEEMHPYGTSAYRSARSGVEVSARRYRYTGKERDEETGLDYFGARYYAPWLGRWTSADPLGLQAGLNLYLYGRASPVVFNDPSGMAPAAANLQPEPMLNTEAGQGPLSGEAPPDDVPVTRVTPSAKASREPTPEQETVRTEPEPTTQQPAPAWQGAPSPEAELKERFGDVLRSFGSGLSLSEEQHSAKGFVRGLLGFTSWEEARKGILPNPFDADERQAWIEGAPQRFLSYHPIAAIFQRSKRNLDNALTFLDDDVAYEARAEAGGEWLGAAGAVLLGALAGRKLGASRVWPKHHPFPTYLGGAVDQTLKKIPRNLHYRFHSALDKWQGGKYARSKGAAHFKDASKRQIIRDLRDFYTNAEGGIFRKYLPDFEQAVRESR